MADVQQLRLTWPELPASIHRIVAEILHGPVVLARSQATGFSPGSADRVYAANGKSAFVKAVNRGRNPDTVDLHRRELEVLQTLPDSVSVPRLLGSFDDGEWVALVIECVDGVHPSAPPSRAEIWAVLSAVAALPAVRANSGWAVFPRATQELAAAFESWTSIRREGWSESLPVGACDRLDELQRLAAGAARAVDGDHLVHLDLRSDNVLLDDGGRAWLVDWPWASVGVRWLDGLTFLLDARLNGSDVDAEEIIASHPLFALAPADGINAVLSGLTSYFLAEAQRPAPENMPTLRAFQREEGLAGLSWLAQRLGWSA